MAERGSPAAEGSVQDQQQIREKRLAQDAAIGAHAKWLAGVFEVGGSMSLWAVPRKNRQDRPQAASWGPIVQVRVGLWDSDEARARRLAELFGGSVGRVEGEHSWRWMADTRSGRAIGVAIQPYAPSRAAFSEAVRHWDELDPMQKVQAVRAFKASDNPSHPRTAPDPHVYDALVADPNFLAGVVDARGSMAQRRYEGHGTGYFYPHITIQTTNLALLEAVQRRYRGRLELRNGSSASSADQNATSTVLWKAQGRAAADLYELIRPHLLLRAEQAAQVFFATPGAAFEPPPSRRATSVNIP